LYAYEHYYLYILSINRVVSYDDLNPITEIRYWSTAVIGWFSSVSGNPDTLNDHVCLDAKLSVPSLLSPSNVSSLSKNCTLIVTVCNVFIVSLLDTLPRTSYEFMAKFLNTLMFDTCKLSRPPLTSLGAVPVSIAFEESPPSFMLTYSSRQRGRDTTPISIICHIGNARNDGLKTSKSTDR
jgi:hypothetical protein